MEEEIKNPELERIVGGINDKLSNKPHYRQIREILKREGKEFLESSNLNDVAEIDDTNKTISFYGPFEETKELMDLIKPYTEKGYKIL